MKKQVKNIWLNEEKIEELLKKGIVVINAGIIMMTFIGCSSKDNKESNRNNLNVIEQTNEDLIAYNSAISDEDISQLPNSIKEFKLHNCPFVTNLDKLPEVCPNIELLVLDKCSSITDLSFIYNLKNLKQVGLNDMCGINYELLDYLNSNNILYEVEDDDIESNNEIDRILSEIINDDMTDEEKIRSIIVYVTKNTSYDLDKKNESNINPLSTTFKDKKGVCYGYAYTANVLMRRAGITSYLMLNDEHAWNMVELDNKHYYIDSTNLGGGGDISKIAADVLSTTGFSLNYLCDPKATSLTGMSDYDSTNIVIPKSLVEDIEKGESEKNILERYGTSIPVRLLELVLLIVALNVGVKKLADISKSIKDSKEKTEKRK